MIVLGRSASAFNLTAHVRWSSDSFVACFIVLEGSVLEHAELRLHGRQLQQ